MNFGSDDLATLFLAAGQEFAGFGQGIILAFDNESFANVIDYRGTQLTNLPVLDRVGATTYQTGEVVLLMKWRPTGRGLGTYWIAGAPVIPGAGNAEEAVEFLTSNLAKAIAVQVFADRINSAEITDIEQCTSATYADIATVGPTVTNVEVSESGKMLVFVSARITLNSVSNSTADGFMSFTVSGASSLAANDNNAAYKALNFATAEVTDIINEAGIHTRVALVTGLNPGIHTVTAKYRRSIGTSVFFGLRNLSVFAF